MGSVIPGSNSGAGTFVIYDTAYPGGIGNLVINSYTTLSIPAYWRAMVYIANTMTSFPRYVVKDGVKAKHRLNSILDRRPNKYQNAPQFWRALFFHRSHYGNGFAEIERDNLYNPVALHNRLPEQVSPFRWIDDDGNISTWYHVGGTRPHIVPFGDMIHLTGGLSYDGFLAQNPVTMHYETLERARLLDRYVARFLKKGSVVRGSVEIPAGVSEEQSQKIVDTITTKFSGPEAQQDILVLSDGATLNNKTLTPEQSQLIEQSANITKQIGQITNVPPPFLYDFSEAKYNDNTEQMNQAVVRDLFRPLVEQDEDEFTLKLHTPTEQDTGYEVEIDFGSLIRGDTTTESNVAVQQRTAGIISANEARGILGYPKSSDPDADTLKASGDTAPKGAAAPPAPPTPQKNSAVVGTEQFTALIQDAAQRVGNKTRAATANAVKTGKDMTVWGNVFSAEQAEQAAQAVAPIFTTMAIVTGKPPVAELPTSIGEKYGHQLRQHFAKLKAGEESHEPNLEQIVIDTVTQGEHEAPAVQ
jgi:HK97 family phage portal protein